MIKAVIYGIIEGITEWLPVSSTGHMILAERVLLFQLSDEFLSMFRVVIQLGAILAVVVLFWDKLWPFCLPDRRRGKGVLACVRMPIIELWLKIAVASVPAAVLGFLLDDWMDEHLYNYLVVALMLIIYGVGFLAIESKSRAARTTRLSAIGYGDAAVMGLWQVLALVPGTSRSGATILGGMLWGMSRPVASQFSFFMAIPVMCGASLLKVVKFLLEGNLLTGAELGILGVGCLVAFVVSLLAIRFLMSYVRSHSFKVFGWYRIGLGILVLAVGIGYRLAAAPLVG